MNEIFAAMAKYGVLVFRDTGLDDTGHVEFSRRFGDLDDIKPYMVNGRKPRFPYYELFDAGNLDDLGEVLGADSQRAHYGKVSECAEFSMFHSAISLVRVCVTVIVMVADGC